VESRSHPTNGRPTGGATEARHAGVETSARTRNVLCTSLWRKSSRKQLFMASSVVTMSKPCTSFSGLIGKESSLSQKGRRVASTEGICGEALATNPGGFSTANHRSRREP